MISYELLLAHSKGSVSVRQFNLTVTEALDGPGLARLLESHYGPVRWYFGAHRLAQLERLDPQRPLILSDVPSLEPMADSQPLSTLELFVADGIDAGAALTLRPGRYILGRAGALGLRDSTVARQHAELVVTHLELRVNARPGCELQVAEPDGDFHPVTQSVLRRGMRLKLGHTILHVDDPIALSDPAVTARSRVGAAPAKPDSKRALSYLAAAIVPLISGLLLATLTGSLIFLALCGVSALMGIVPALGLLRARRKFRRELRHYLTTLQVHRQHQAEPVGVVARAGLARRRLGLSCGAAPVLRWGTGRFAPYQAEPADESSSSARRRREKARDLRLDIDSPIFTVMRPGAWQLVGERDESCAELLAALVAGMLPELTGGRLRLVLEPALGMLPSNLLLLPGVSTGYIPAASAQKPQPGDTVRTVYVGTRLQPAPEASLVLYVGDPTVRTEYWVDVHGASANLAEAGAHLQTLARLCPTRLSRLVDEYLRLELRDAPRSLARPDSSVHPAPSAAGCVIGSAPQGAEVTLDLLADGPHFLLCGTTGSGKSEALRRIVTALCSTHAPEELALILVDFKGGAGLGPLAGLPQVQLACSDLDEAAAQRLLGQLEAEILRRERLFAAAGCSDIADYQRVGATQAVPRLLVVIDEFRVFIESLPAATARVERLATVGRALGVQLLLSTQRPGGTLTGQARANIATVIALRVTQAAESMELLGSARAAELTEPGQAVIKRGSGAVTEFCFHRAVPGAAHGWLAERQVMGFALAPARLVGHPDDERTLQEALAERVAELAQHATTLPTNPFAAPLPETQEVHQVAQRMGLADPDMLGLVDDIPGGTLRALSLDRQRTPSLLVSGLPQAGGAMLSQLLLTSGRHVVLFGALPSGFATSPGLIHADGDDPYHFEDVLDMVRDAPDQQESIVLVRYPADLQQRMPPRRFERLDETLCMLLRTSQGTQKQVVIMADRDQSCLKASSMCAEQWYFPLDAPQSLRMLWPQLPPVGESEGRGIRVRAGLQEEFQLCAPEPRRADQLSDVAHRQDPVPVFGGGAFELGVSGFQPRTVDLVPEPMSVVLVACSALRVRVAQELCRLWGVDLLTGATELSSRCTPEADMQNSPIYGVLFDSTAPAAVATSIQQALACGLRLVLFVPPGVRLPYELGLGAGFDERTVAAVEPLHSMDVQPLSWAPLSPRSASDRQNDRTPVRALALVEREPRLIRLPLTDGLNAVDGPPDKPSSPEQKAGSGRHRRSTMPPTQ
ncbi:hypothetical protein GCM10027417_24170 [Glutamicibacter endophyticus]